MEMSPWLRWLLVAVAVGAGGLGGYSYYADATRSLEFGTPAVTLFLAAGLSLFLVVVGLLLRKPQQVVIERPAALPREARNSSVPTSMPYEAPQRDAPMLGASSPTRPTQRLNTQQRRKQTRASVPLPKPLPPPQE